GSVCGSNLTCASGTCVCGDKDEPCCDGTTTCGGNLACEGGSCACGAHGEPCCGGTTCDTGLSCPTGTRAAGVIELALGRGTMCALLTDHTVECWGHDGFTFGRSAPSRKTAVIDTTAPVAITNATDVVEIAGGEGHTCVKKSDGTLWCFGHN